VSLIVACKLAARNSDSASCLRKDSISSWKVASLVPVKEAIS
jgi:hypothetical protein